MIGGGTRDDCCPASSLDLATDCDDATQPSGPAIDSIIEFSINEDSWLNYYIRAWNIATQNGYNDLKKLQEIPFAKI